MCKCADVQIEEKKPALSFLLSAHLHIRTFAHYPYCASAILICNPALVVVIGGAVDIFGITLLWSKYNLILTRLFNT